MSIIRTIVAGVFLGLAGAGILAEAVAPGVGGRVDVSAPVHVADNAKGSGDLLIAADSGKGSGDLLEKREAAALIAEA
jgi:hypothetical protein